MMPPATLRRVDIIARTGSSVTIGVPDEHGGQATLVLDPPYVDPMFLATPGTTGLLLMVGPVPHLLPGDTVIAGDPAGNHVELTASGMYVYVLDPVDLTLREAIRLGTATDDFFAITDALGNSVAAISSSGSASFAALSSTMWPTIGSADWTGVGGALDQILDRRPRGVVEHVQVAFPTTFAATIAETGAFEFGAHILPGRSYLLSGRVRVKSTVAGDTAELRVRYTAAPLGAVKPLLPAATFVVSASDVGTLAKGVRIETVFDAFSSVPSEFRFLLTYARIAGTGSVSLDPVPAEPIDFVVTDLGPSRAFGGWTLNTGTGSEVTPPPIQRTLTVAGSWTNAYIGDGSQPGVNTAWQGHTNASGMRKAMIGFPELTQLAGATIQSVVLRLNATQWSLPSGGTGIVGFHTYLAQPSGSLTGSSSYTTDVVRQVWSGLGVGFVDLTGYAPQEWVTGVKRGIYIGLAHGVEDLSTQIRGSFAGALHADTTIRPQLTITYTV